MSTQVLTSGSIPRQVRDLALPSSIGLVFQTMYNVVDSFWAGKISTLALAALGLSFPVFLLIIATGGGLSRGSSALIANAIGAGDEERQKRYVTQAISLGILVSVGLTVTGLLTSDSLFRLLGASGEYLTIAQSYITPIFIGSVFFVISNLCNAILIASGDSKTFSKVLFVGFFLNLVLDPWFLYGGLGLPAMGVAGIAWATVIIQMAGSLFMLWTVLRKGLLSLSPWQDFLPDLKTYREIAQQALPASLNIMSVAIGFFVITYYLKTYGEASVAAFGVTTRVEQLGLLPTMGLYSAIMALVGQNNGAGNIARVHETMRVCNRVGMLLILTSSLIIFLFAKQVMGIFTSDEEVIGLGVQCLYIIMPIQWSYVMTSTHLAMLQALKRPNYGLIESVSRRVLLPLPFFYVCVLAYEMDIVSVWYSIAGTNVFMTAITMYYARHTLRDITRRSKENPRPQLRASGS